MSGYNIFPAKVYYLTDKENQHTYRAEVILQGELDTLVSVAEVRERSRVFFSEGSSPWLRVHSALASKGYISSNHKKRGNKDE